MCLRVLSEFFQLTDWAVSLVQYHPLLPVLYKYHRSWHLDHKIVKGAFWRLMKKRERQTGRLQKRGWCWKTVPGWMGPTDQAEGRKKVLDVDWDELPFSFLFVPRTLLQSGHLTHHPGCWRPNQLSGTAMVQFKRRWSWASFKLAHLGLRGRQTAQELMLNLSCPAFPGPCADAKQPTPIPAQSHCHQLCCWLV